MLVTKHVTICLTLSFDTVLLASADSAELERARGLLANSGFRRVRTAEDTETARKELIDHPADVLVVSASLDLLPWLHNHASETTPIVFARRDALELALQRMREGAHDVVISGTEDERLVPAVQRALQHGRSRDEHPALRKALAEQELRNPSAFAAFITRSAAMRRIFVYLESVAPTRDPVLITGETGVGKELVARGVHAASGRRGSFVAVNLGGLDDHTIADTFFGHVRGAFTGADSVRHGLLEKAADGTLLLDEFAELSPESQVKLLRLIDTGEYIPLGSDTVRRHDSRLILATNVDLEKQVRRGAFRQDLFYRISQHWVDVPPLRERREDIEPIVRSLMEAHARRLEREPIPVTPELLSALSKRRLEGNVRELEHLVVTAIINGEWRLPAEGFHAESEEGCEDPFAYSHTVAFGAELPTPKTVIEELLREADRRYPNNRTRAAAAIGLTPQAFANRWKRMDVERD